MTQTILIVDDDPVQRRLLESCISRSGHQTLTAPGGGPALELLLSPKGEQISLVLLDLIMPDVDGIQVLTKLRATNPDLPVIVLTAKGGIDSAVEAMRAGANDFLVKPTSPERIKVSIQNALKLGVLTGEVSRLKKKQQNQLGFADLVGKSFPDASGDPPRRARGAILHSHPDRRRIGVGKELIARAIRAVRARRQTLCHAQLRAIPST
jgi:DNA-binding NtrC family response regulator